MRAIFIALLVTGTPLMLCVPPECYLPVVLNGIEVSVLNDQTGEYVTGAVLTIRDGDYVEILSGSMGGYFGAQGRAGTYTLTVEAKGFQTKTMENIVVERGPCNPITVVLEVRLTPS